MLLPIHKVQQMYHENQEWRQNKKQDISITPFPQRMEYPAFTI